MGIKKKFNEVGEFFQDEKDTPEKKAMREEAEKKEKEEKVSGLGGWLILPIIGLFISIPILLVDLLSINASYEFDSYIGLLSLLDIAMIVLIIVALVSIFSKKRYAPSLLISFYIANIVIQGAVAFLVEDFTQFIPALIGGGVWITYFLVSKRVKNTFVK